MRVFNKGEPFTHVTSDSDPNLPVFSEAFLYYLGDPDENENVMTKGDARFVLAVADEYEALIHHFGSEQVRRWLEEALDAQA